MRVLVAYEVDIGDGVALGEEATLENSAEEAGAAGYEDIFCWSHFHEALRVFCERNGSDDLLRVD